MIANLRKIISIIIINTLFLSVGKLGYAKDNFIYVEVGTPMVSDIIPNDRPYQPLLVLFRMENTFHKVNQNADFRYYIEPQYAFVSEYDFEYGLNFGFNFTYHYSQEDKLFIGIGSGPHYITKETKLQANTFLFSDNLYFGNKFYIADNFYLITEFRIRHLSNLDLIMPNLGLDNLFFVLGIRKKF